MNACSVQMPPLRTNTYAAPTQMFACPRGGESLSHPGGLMPDVRQSSSPGPARVVAPAPKGRQKPDLSPPPPVVPAGGGPAGVRRLDIGLLRPGVARTRE